MATRNTTSSDAENAAAYAARTDGDSEASISPVIAEPGAGAPEVVAGSRVASSPPRRTAKIAPRTAVPTDPPMSRNNVAPDVATPRSR